MGGSTNPVKEYVIGIEVFDRDDSYDPRLDPIVRVEARRLRLKLQRYYEQEGASDRVRIEMPSRGYTPQLRYIESSEQEDGQKPISQTGDRISVAVVPFTGVSRSTEPFAAGLTDEIIHVLSGTARIEVLARNCIAHSRSSMDDVTATGYRPDPDYVLEGSVRRENANLRVCVRLASSSSGFCIWSRAYEQKLQGVFLSQKRIAAQMVNDAMAYLSTKTTHPNRFTRAPEPSAHALYSKGRSYLNSRTKTGIHQSLDCFQRVIDSMPEYALAYAGLADAYSLGARYNVFPHHESWRRARSAALDALRIDYSLAEAHTSLGFVDLHYGRDWWSAEREFCTAILLNPRYAPARQWYAWYLAATGRSEMAVSTVEQAVLMDPLSSNAQADLALAHYFARDYGQALRQCERTLALEPGFYRAHQLAGAACYLQGDLADAVAHLELAISLADGNARGSALLANAYAATGRIGPARQIFASFLDGPRSRVSAIDVALFCMAIGDFDKVFDWLEKAYQEQEAELLWLRVDPIYDGVRNDPRFTNLLMRLGNPPLPRLCELIPKAPAESAHLRRTL